MKRGTPSSPPAKAGGAEVAEIGDGETTVEGAAGATNENSKGIGILHVSQHLRPHLRVQGLVQAPATFAAAAAAAPAPGAAEAAFRVSWGWWPERHAAAASRRP